MTQCVTMKKARSLAKLGPPTDPEGLRDFVDLHTGGELDSTQLNLLTGWIETIICNNQPMEVE